MRRISDIGAAVIGSGLHRHRPHRGAASPRRPDPRGPGGAPRIAARSGPPSSELPRAYALDGGNACRRARRGRPRHLAQRAPLPAGQPSWPPGEHVVCEKPLAMTRPSRRSWCAWPPTRASSTPSTSTSASTRSTSTSRETVARRRARRGAARHRPLLPGLAPPGDRLELASRAGSRAAPCERSATSGRTGWT